VSGNESDQEGRDEVCRVEWRMREPMGAEEIPADLP
jgi:hypothetical protein